MTVTITPIPFEEVTGKIEYGFMNDYMFRAILQKNNNVLKALICALLHLKKEDIRSITITNPIVLGEAISDKEFILDITVLMNDNTHIDLEMQIRNEGEWPERSLAYLCRSYDQIGKGGDYADIGPAIHIGFLNFTPFKKDPEFYATYKLMNVKNHNVYSDKFVLSVVDLTKVDMATEEDKCYKIDRWARLFKAATWEELKMIASEDKDLREAAETLYVMNCDKTIQDMCRARLDYENRERSRNRKMAQLTADKAQLTADNAQLTADKERLTAEIARLKALAGQNTTPPEEQ
jgi:predicted transposase/invertase (TIGR01784 family)